MKCCIIADDLTGACDTGAAFARQGFDTRVILKTGGQSGDSDVLVYSTESRYLPEDRAAGSVSRVLDQLPVEQYPILFKKIDSTLRGHPASELKAVMEKLRLERVLLTPAFPAQGRTVHAGQLWIRGERLEDTVFATPSSQGNLARLFDFSPTLYLLDLQSIRKGEAALAQVLAQRSHGIFIADAESDSDLDVIAKAGLTAGIRLWCGSAGLGRSLAASLGPVDADVQSEKPEGPWLVVAGSRSPVTLVQVTRLEQDGAKVVSLEDGDVSPDDAHRRLASKAHSAAAGLEAGNTVVISTRSLSDSPGKERVVAACLALLTAFILDSVTHFPAGLVLTGGDIAAAVCENLSCSSLRLLDELEPGLALGRMVDGKSPGLWVITKAGGFGREDTLLNVL